MVLHRLAHLLLAGTDIDDNLLARRREGRCSRKAFLLLCSCCRQPIQDIGDHLHCGAYGDGYHDDIGLLDAVFIADYFVYQADGMGRFRRYGVALYAEGPRRKAAPFQVQGQGTSDKAQADDADRFLYLAHSQCFIIFNPCTITGVDYRINLLIRRLCYNVSY